MTTVDKYQVLVRDLRLKDIKEQLPKNVFPVCLSLALSRGSRKDDPHLQTDDGEPIKQDAWPLNVNIPAEKPYIANQTVWFSNPAEYPSNGWKLWRFEEFSGKLDQITAAVDAVEPKASNRLYLKTLTLCEVDPEYAYTDDDGLSNVSPDLYADDGDMAIATFSKRNTVDDETVREKLGPSLPGNVTKPVKMDEILTVRAKRHRTSPASISGGTTTQYWTEGKINQHSKPLSYSPSTIESPRWVNVQDHFPELGTTGFIEEIKFVGEETEENEFHETDAVVVSGAKAGGQKTIADGGSR